MPTIASVSSRLMIWAKFIRFDRRTVFEKIFAERYWGDAESVSGIGSSLAQTANARRHIPLLISQFDIRTVLDAPCGDFHWMREVDFGNATYVGGDIAPGVVDRARENAAGMSGTATPPTFKLFDIVADPMTPVDLWICRDCLFHLSYAEIKAALRNFVDSGSKYVLLTTHTGPHFRNRNIVTGDFRELDMFAAPIGLPRDALYAFDDYADPLPARKMILLSNAQVAEAARGWSR